MHIQDKYPRILCNRHIAALAIDIFVDAITQMTIGGARAILQGTDDAAQPLS